VVQRHPEITWRQLPVERDSNAGTQLPPYFKEKYMGNNYIPGKDADYTIISLGVRINPKPAAGKKITL
jgi:hypothetical protein